MKYPLLSKTVFAEKHEDCSLLGLKSSHAMVFVLPETLLCQEQSESACSSQPILPSVISSPPTRSDKEKIWRCFKITAAGWRVKETVNLAAGRPGNETAHIPSIACWNFGLVSRWLFSTDDFSQAPSSSRSLQLSLPRPIYKEQTSLSVDSAPSPELASLHLLTPRCLWLVSVSFRLPLPASHLTYKTLAELWHSRHVVFSTGSRAAGGLDCVAQDRWELFLASILAP